MCGIGRWARWNSQHSSLLSTEEPVHSTVHCSSVPAVALEAEEYFEAADFGCQLQVLGPGHPTVQKMELRDY